MIQLLEIMSCMDNQFYAQGCPAIMNDGRFITSYSTEQTIVDSIRLANRIDVCKYDNNDFRFFLQNNACKIMQKEREYLSRNYFCWVPRRPIKIELPFFR